MAKKKTSATPTGDASQKQAVQIKVVIDVPEGSEPYYANHVEVGCSRFDFFLLFARMPTKVTSAVYKAAVDQGEIHVPATVQLVIPASIVAGLMRALETQKAKFEKDNGKIPDLGANAPKPEPTNAKSPTKTH
jgi:hypothetical protein